MPKPKPKTERPKTPLSDFAKRGKLLIAMLDVEHAMDDKMSTEEREKADSERQMFAMKMGWTRKPIPELEEECKALTGKLPY